MKKLVTGLLRFREHVFDEHRELFEQLRTGQRPQALFVTCSDSRLDPTLLTQTDPGDLFILRNAGNLVPPHGASQGGEAATLEYALGALGIEHVVVCGHSHCGAMQALIDPAPLAALPSVAAWLEHAGPTRGVIERCYADRSAEEKLNVAIQENVLQQLANLRTHPAVAERLAERRLHLHAWVYKFETGEVFAYDGLGQFRAIGETDGAIAERRAEA